MIRINSDLYHQIYDLIQNLLKSKIIIGSNTGSVSCRIALLKNNRYNLYFRSLVPSKVLTVPEALIEVLSVRSTTKPAVAL
jgi:hypothetical protein